ncbi:hypothetical protein [Streptoalloteichus hindustanus]|uniref:Uncharacterized protein n=1 Tax=Streptoalloteichus hindustanus TaxID=2017 RepID=A0A1M5JCS8_STRHI|nr:hypothetical protein [Streptoalloteichus hindustanus]SHG37823.1 hypothetical protein SAMN05444320_108210 [Streptoalloteichus hindustanus]
MQVRWLQDKVQSKLHDRMQKKWVARTRAWVSGAPQGDVGAADRCMVCGKQLRRHRTVAGEGRVCSPECALAWAETLES